MTDSLEHAIEEVLFSEDANRYGDHYHSHFLTMYRDYVSSADTNSARRNAANSFFLTINSVFLGAAGYFKVNTHEVVLVQAAVGILFCTVWWLMIRSYRSLNRSKFDVIQLMERRLPLAPYSAEWVAHHAANSRHRALSKIESYVPALFGVLYFAMATLQFGG